MTAAWNSQSFGTSSHFFLGATFLKVAQALKYIYIYIYKIYIYFIIIKSEGWEGRKGWEAHEI